MMTEEEKKAALETAKSRIANAAIKLATVATLATPAPTAAHTATENTSPDNTHTVTVAAPQNSTMEIMDVKDAKTVAFTAQLNNLAEPTNPSDETTPEALKRQSDRAELITNNLDTYIAVEQAAAQNLNNQLNSPVDENNKTTQDNETAIGPFIGFILDEELDKKTKYKSNFKSPRNEKETEIRVINSKDDLKKYDNLAYFDYNDKKIHMPKYQFSEEMQNKLNQLPDEKKKELNWSYKTYINDPTAEIAIERHENTHFTHNARGQTNRENQTPDMAVEQDYVTEKTAFAVQNLTLANLYKNFKESGMEYIQINGVNQPIADILNPCPGLKEAIDQHGFDPKDPQSVSRVVKLASAQWDKEYLQGYSNEQFAQRAELATTSYSIMEQIRAARDQQKILTDMTKNLDIGYNTKIDIPADCLADMLPKKEITQSITSKATTFSPSTEGLLAIDDYLNKIGLKNDEQKDQYLKENYSKIVNRAPDADNKLKDLMLACGNKDNQEIFYTDNLIVKNQNGIQTVSAGRDQPQYAVTPLDNRVDLAATNTKTTEHTSSAKQALTPAQIAKAKGNSR